MGSSVIMTTTDSVKELNNSDYFYSVIWVKVYRLSSRLVWVMLPLVFFRLQSISRRKTMIRNKRNPEAPAMTATKQKVGHRCKLRSDMRNRQTETLIRQYSELMKLVPISLMGCSGLGPLGSRVRWDLTGCVICCGPRGVVAFTVTVVVTVCTVVRSGQGLVGHFSHFTSEFSVPDMNTQTFRKIRASHRK